MLEVTKSFLEAIGEAEVLTCGSAIEALELIPNQRVKAIVSDYQMPGMDGIEFLKVVRARWPNMPFILFTGKGREEVAMEALHHGADSYIMKGGDAASQFKVLANEVDMAVARHEAEEAVHYNLSRFNLIMRNLSEIIFMLTEAGEIAYVSPSISTVLGFTREEVEGRNVEEFRALALQRGEAASALHGLQASFTGEGAFFDVRAKDGSQRTLLVKSTPIVQGSERLLISTAKDITYLKRVEAQLLVRDHLFSSILDMMPIASGITDLETGTIFHINKAVAELMGYEKDEMIGKTTVELGLWTEEERKALIGSLPSGRMMFGLEVDMRARDGIYQKLMVNAAAVDVDDRHFLFFMIRGRAGEEIPTVEKLLEGMSQSIAGNI